MLPADVEAFQRGRLNHLGKPLKVDGDCGPETEWARDFATLCAERRSIVRAAQMFLRLTEHPVGSNGDPAGIIQGWLEQCGARPGDPWCAAFLSHCLGTVRFPGAQALGKHFPPTDSPLPADIMWYPTVGRRGHCGLVIGVSALEVMTIEGNLRHAVRCARRDRQGLRFSRTVEDTEGTCPGVVPAVPVAKGGTR